MASADKNVFSVVCAPWPESLEDYFQKAALNLWYVTSLPGQILKNCSRSFEGLLYLAYKFFQKILSLFFYSHHSNRPFQ